LIYGEEKRKGVDDKKRNNRNLIKKKGTVKIGQKKEKKTGRKVVVVGYRIRA